MSRQFMAGKLQGDERKTIIQGVRKANARGGSGSDQAAADGVL